MQRLRPVKTKMSKQTQIMIPDTFIDIHETLYIHVFCGLVDIRVRIRQLYLMAWLVLGLRLGSLRLDIIHVSCSLVGIRVRVRYIH